MTNDLRKFCVAPMMGYTTPHAIRLYRILSKKAYLFTEMIPSKTLIYFPKRDQIINNYNQNPIALQVGGSEFKDLIECANIAENYNYNEINLNVGCPSKAVQKGSFGACLMKDKYLVSDCLKAMLDTCNIDVTMKCRLGVDNQSSYDFFSDFIEAALKSGIRVVYVHARNAILKGLNPKNNRTIPPLKYDYVTKIKQDFPEATFIINGGINSLNKAREMSLQFDGVMLGRLIQSNPFSLLEVDNMFFNSESIKNDYKNIVLEYFDYIKLKIKEESIYRLLSPLLLIFFGSPNSKKFRNEVHQKMKDLKINQLETMFLKFIQ